MSQDKVVCEFVTAKGTQWPPLMIAEFKSHEYQGGFAIERGSSEEIRFRARAEELGAQYREYWYLKSDPAHADSCDLFQFQFEYDKEYPRDLPNVWETYVSACNERGTRCSPFVNRPPLLVDMKRGKKADLLQIPNWFRPRIFLVSARARELLESISATGIEFRRCRFEGLNSNHGSSDPFFEMIVTGRLPDAPRVSPSHIAPDQRCTVCGLVNSFVPSTPISICVPTGRSDSDFSFASHVSSESEQFELGFWFYCASARVLSAMKKAKLTGFRPTLPHLGVAFSGVFRCS